jgi:hypothetical protein
LALGERIVGGLRGRAVKAAQASTGIRAIWNVALALVLALGLEFFLGVGARTATFVNSSMHVIETTNRNTGATWGIFREGEKARIVPFTEGTKRIGCVPGDTNCYLELSFEHRWLGVRGLALVVISLILFLVSALTVQLLLGRPAVLQGESFTMTHAFSDEPGGEDLCTVTRVYGNVRTTASRFTFPLVLSYDQFNDGPGEPQPRIEPGSLKISAQDTFSRDVANVRLAPPRTGVASYGGDVIADDCSQPLNFRVEYKVRNIFPRDLATAHRRSGGHSDEDSTEWEPKAFWERVQLQFINTGPLREVPRLFTKVAGADDEHEVRSDGWSPNAWMLAMKNVPQDRHLVFKWRLRDK